jgi:N-acetylglucosamine malate deacetylase 2
MKLIRDWIAGLILKEHYDYLFCILPRPTTHGAHQAATMLAAASIDKLPQQLRPLLVGFDTDEAPLARGTNSWHWASEYAFAFDRTSRFGFQNSLNYQIVVDWMIGAHKSQGLLQTMCEKETKEYAWVSRASVPKADVTTESLAALLGKPAAHE